MNLSKAQIEILDYMRCGNHPHIGRGYDYFIYASPSGKTVKRPTIKALRRLGLVEGVTTIKLTALGEQFVNSEEFVRP